MSFLGEAGCECTSCGDLFNSTTAFDGHRIGAFESPAAACQRRCLSASEMEAKGWLRNQRGFWITGARQASAAPLERPTGTPVATPVEVTP